MENFDLRKTAIYSAVRWERFFVFRFAKLATNVFLVLSVLSFLLIGLSILGFLSVIGSLRFFSFFLFFYVIFWEISLFFNTGIKKPKVSATVEQVAASPKEYNVAEFLSFEAAKVVGGAFRFCKRRRIPEMSAAALLYSALEASEQTKYIFMRLGLTAKDIQSNLKNYLEKLERNDSPSELFTEDFTEAIKDALAIAQQRKHQRIEARDILIGISKTEFFEKILLDKNLKLEDFENISLWFDYLERRIEESRKFWEQENLAIYGSLGKDWATGYTITLDKYSIDWRRIVKKWMFKAIIGHEKEVELVQAGLCRPEANNVLIIGDSGTGRESIVEGLARRVFLGKSVPELNYFRVVELDMPLLLSQVTNIETVESELDNMFQEVVTAGNIILVIKDFHNFIGQDVSQPGKVDISGILGKYLRFPEFRFVAITDFNGLHTRIEKNQSLADMFTKIEVQEISEPETMRILQNLALELERKYKVFIVYPAIREIVILAGRYIPNIPFPKKAIDLLQDVVVYVARSIKEKVVLPEHVSKIISTKTEIPVGKIESKEKDMLLNLEKLIHERIVNQNEAVEQVSISMRRARAGISSKKRPMGVFLFLGPTGVGKTETSKALAQIYFGGEDKMSRLDMSEFQSITDIPRLIGSSGQEGLLTTPVRENPFSLLLLDEIEKAHPNILNLFLQVFDEGHITDGQGRKTVFTNCIIICTSNAGAEYIFESVKNNIKLEKEKILDLLFNKGIFKPEFINRFDAAVMFKPLTKENLLDIAGLMLSSLKKSIEEKKIEFIVTEKLKEKIVQLSYNPAFGAREMRRVIQDKVENTVANALLADIIKKGDAFEISANDFSLVKKIKGRRTKKLKP
ncbi:MAG: ATP-dependent Clp protease ATP-binding subunit [Candidatus Staskawiczbacteria bacterium]|jgi:ATP-dependent Clp protease ATP-binding subunit ClpC